MAGTTDLEVPPLGSEVEKVSAYWRQKTNKKTCGHGKKVHSELNKLAYISTLPSQKLNLNFGRMIGRTGQ